ncbi:carboxylesterase family protein [Pseudonocardia sp. NPDC049635]|uniref:carboxylesterase/lipase family protein n=1 Tax=Pseudonocardia sp. NPDC049635 TaxID=3155506 RepID=UPI0033C93FDC
MIVTTDETLPAPGRLRTAARSALAALSAGLLLSACGTPAAPDPDGPATSVVAQGALRGEDAGTHRTYRGIPYAAPPVGDGRWAAPGPAPGWDGVRDAARSGAACPQLPSSVADLASETEDCLFLDVTVPAGATPDRPRPVMVWIHGGSGTNGAAGVFDAHRLATDGDVVVVTVNYRLGVLGGFGLPGLADAGSFGLLDQQAALRWVRHNIGALGGDPRSVTLFGESYGALSASAHLVSPQAEGLFDRVILQSGLALQTYPPDTVMPGTPALPSLWIDQDELGELGNGVATALGCAPGPGALACLRSRPVTDLLPLSAQFSRFAWGNRALPAEPAAELHAGRVHRVPVLSGATRDEHRLYVAAFFDDTGSPVTAQQYPHLLRRAFGDRAGEVAARYPLEAHTTPSLAWATVLTDRVWATATDAQNRSLAAVTPTWAFEFADRGAPPAAGVGGGFAPGAYHSADVFYLFDAAGGAPYGELRPESRRLADRMVRHWSAFARTGSPALPEAAWPPFDPGSPHVQTLDTDPDAPPTDYRAEHRLDFWASFPGTVAGG